MASHDLTLEEARETFRYDPDSGMLYRRHGERERVGTARSHGYLLVGFGKRTYKVHQVAWLLTHESWPAGPIKHRNRIKTDNRSVNLQCGADDLTEASPAEMASVQTVGVVAEGGRWVAAVPYEGTLLDIGPFDTHEAAHDAFATVVSTALVREPRRNAPE